MLRIADSVCAIDRRDTTLRFAFAFLFSRFRKARDVNVPRNDKETRSGGRLILISTMSRQLSYSLHDFPSSSSQRERVSAWWDVHSIYRNLSIAEKSSLVRILISLRYRTPIAALITTFVSHRGQRRRYAVSYLRAMLWSVAKDAF